MKKGIVLLLCSTLALMGSAQTGESINALIDRLNADLARYADFSPPPFADEYLSIAELGLSETDERLLLEEESYDNNLSDGKDSVTSMYVMDFYQERILVKIDSLVDHPDFTKTDIADLINLSHDLSFVCSDDRKLCNFSLAEKTGGTYRSRISFMYYADLQRPDTTANDQDQHDPYEVFERDGYGEIYTIKTEKGTRYVLSGHVRGCSYCFETHVSMVGYEDGVFKTFFHYSITSRDATTGVTYEPETQRIVVDYETDDLTPECDCGQESEFTSVEEEFDFDSTWNCHCSFQFNGLNFELVRESREKAKH
ncbi:MAG: hypothetical protein AAFV95_00665 [Bacteroidota bacterium]